MIATKFGVLFFCSSDHRFRRVAIGSGITRESVELCRRYLDLLLRPFAVGDYIIVNSEGIEGTVKVIQIFDTKMTTIDNKTIVVPNSILTSNSLTNEQKTRNVSWILKW